MHRIEVYNQRRKPTLTVDTHGVVDDNGGGGTTTSKRCPRHKCSVFFHPIKVVGRRLETRG